MIFDRVKKRTETDLDDTELQLLIDEANQAVIAKVGPHADPGAPITVRVDGRSNRIVLDRAIDTSETVTVTEYETYGGWGTTEYDLTSDDYLIWPGGTILERLATGPNSRSRWFDQVEVTYVPANDGDQREEVIIKLVMLAIQYEPVSAKRVGDVSENNLDYSAEREALLSSLMPRPGLFLA